MYATTRIFALLGVTIALTTLLVAGALCCVDAAVACTDESDHRPQTATHVVPTSARALASTPAMAAFGETHVVALVPTPRVDDPSTPQTARLQLRI